MSLKFFIKDVDENLNEIGKRNAVDLKIKGWICLFYFLLLLLWNKNIIWVNLLLLKSKDNPHRFTDIVLIFQIEYFFHRLLVVWLFYRLWIISLIDWGMVFLFHCISDGSIIGSYAYTNQISSVISVSSSSVIMWKIKIQTVTSIREREQMVLWKSILTGYLSLVFNSNGLSVFNFSNCWGIVSTGWR